ncbi:MAG: PepSY domain-containing protein [Pirellulales bacterium]|nr:PepSY domain-containing protein [Pirellulales bacterium]
MKRFGIAALVATVAPLLMAASGPPNGRNGRLAMGEVAHLLEKDGYGPLVEISFDDGAWEVETYHGDDSLELSVDPRTGEVISEHRDDAQRRPPQGSLRLSQVIRALEKAGYSNLSEASFERRYWEVEADRDGDQRELHVDPKSADVISDRADD